MELNNGNANPGEKLYDLSKLKEISRGNDAFVKRMIQIFYERTPSLLNQINEAYNTGNYKTVRDVAHLLKPSIDNLGITSITKSIRNIEDLALENDAPDLLKEKIKKVEEILLLVSGQLKEELK